MAGHSQYKNIMHRKGRQDARKGKILNKISREIIVASRGGSADPASNPRLRAAIAEAKANSMPRDRIERAIKAGQPGGDDKSNYEALRYEGYGPGSVAIIVETLTDNRNRTAPELRTIFGKNGGNIGEQNSVLFQFTHLGQVVYPAAVASADAVMEAAIEAGADDVESTDESHFIRMAVEDFGTVVAALEAKFGEPSEAKLIWTPNVSVAPALAEAQTLMKLIDALEDQDDVQAVYANFELTDDVAAALDAA